MKDDTYLLYHKQKRFFEFIHYIILTNNIFSDKLQLTDKWEEVENEK